MSLFTKAVRSQAKLRLALIGPSGSGKTFSALALATELAKAIGLKHPRGRIAVIDSERGSAKLYANEFDFDHMDLVNHSPIAYCDSIEAAEREGYDFIVCDSLSHAWMGKDGALEQVDKAVERGSGNSFAAWRTVTPKHNALVDKILSCKSHFIATIRAKTEYVQEKNDKGKTEIKKLGMQAVQRDGLEYEFTLVGDLDLQNTLKISKTRLNGVVLPNEIYEKPGAVLAGKIGRWLMDGAPIVEAPREEVRQFVADMAASDKPDELGKMIDAGRAALDRIPDEPRTEPLAEALDAAFAGYLTGLQLATSVDDLILAAKGPGKPAKGTPQAERASAIYKAQKRMLEERAAADGAAA